MKRKNETRGEPLPRQLKPKELPKSLRAGLWLVIYGSLEQHTDRGEFVSPWEEIFRVMHVARDHEMIDDFVNDVRSLVHKTRAVFENGDYIAVFDWIRIDRLDRHLLAPFVAR